MDAPKEYRRFRDRPTMIFVNDVRDRILQTGLPELIPELYRMPIASSEPHIRLAEIHIDAKLRPNGDWAPCPMCRKEDKFLDGRLIYLPRLQAVAFIGHCCADKDVAAEANRLHEIEAEQKVREDFLFGELPRIPARLRKLDALLPAAKEARHAFELFHGRAATIQKRLRGIAAKGGILAVTEQVDSQIVGVGPRAFGSAGTAREVSSGVLNGVTALRAGYNPAAELEQTIARLSLLNQGETEEAALDFIVRLEPEEQRRVCKHIRDADRALARIKDGLKDFGMFFERHNFERLDAWGRDHRNPEYLEARLVADGANTLAILKGDGCTVRILIAPSLWALPE